MQATYKCKRFDGNDPSYRDCALNDLEPLNSCYLPKEENESLNQVNHPSHYQQAGRRECIEEMRIVFGDEAVMQWAIMTAYKYRYRAGNKDGNSAEQDHAKAEWYLKYAEQLRDLGY